MLFLTCLDSHLLQVSADVCGVVHEPIGQWGGGGVERSPLLLQGVLQHFDPPHEVFLQVLLAFPLPLQEGYLGLKTQQLDCQVRFEK